MPFKFFLKEEDEDEVEDILRKARTGAGSEMEQWTARAEVRVGGEHAVVIAYVKGGLGATSVDTAGGAVDGVDTTRKSSGDG